MGSPKNQKIPVASNQPTSSTENEDDGSIHLAQISPLPPLRTRPTHIRSTTTGSPKNKKIPVASNQPTSSNPSLTKQGRGGALPNNNKKTRKKGALTTISRPAVVSQGRPPSSGGRPAAAGLAASSSTTHQPVRRPSPTKQGRGGALPNNNKKTRKKVALTTMSRPAVVSQGKPHSSSGRSAAAGLAASSSTTHQPVRRPSPTKQGRGGALPNNNKKTRKKVALTTMSRPAVVSQGKPHSSSGRSAAAGLAASKQTQQWRREAPAETAAVTKQIQKIPKKDRRQQPTPNSPEGMIIGRLLNLLSVRDKNAAAFFQQQWREYDTNKFQFENTLYDTFPRQSANNISNQLKSDIFWSLYNLFTTDKSGNVVYHPRISLKPLTKGEKQSVYTTKVLQKYGGPEETLAWRYNLDESERELRKKIQTLKMKETLSQVEQERRRKLLLGQLDKILSPLSLKDYRNSNEAQPESKFTTLFAFLLVLYYGYDEESEDEEDEEDDESDSSDSLIVNDIENSSTRLRDLWDKLTISQAKNAYALIQEANEHKAQKERGEGKG